MDRVPSRAGFVVGGVSLAASLLVPRPLRAAGARPGYYCRPLRAGAEERRFDFELPLLDGANGSFRLSDLDGFAVWLNFFTTWCGPCNDEASDLVDYAHRYYDAGLRVVGIDVGEDAARVRRYRDHYKIDYPIALDGKESVFGDFRMHAIPSHLFLDRAGRITCYAVTDLSARSMDNEITVAIGSEPRPQATQPTRPADAVSPHPSDPAPPQPTNS